MASESSKTPDDISIDLTPLKEEVSRTKKKLTLSSIELGKLEARRKLAGLSGDTQSDVRTSRPKDY